MNRTVEVCGLHILFVKVELKNKSHEKTNQHKTVLYAEKKGWPNMGRDKKIFYQLLINILRVLFFSPDNDSETSLVLRYA